MTPSGWVAAAPEGLLDAAALRHRATPADAPADLAGRPMLVFAHAALCEALSEGVDPDLNAPRLAALWRDHADLLLDALRLPELAAACDGLAEGDAAGAPLALAAGLLASTVSLLPPGTAAAADNALLDRIARAEGLAPRAPLPRILREIVSRAAPALSPELATLGPPSHPARKTMPWDAAPDADLPGFVLLNDTARLSGGFHCGTVMACAALRDGLTARGLADLGWANSREGLARLLDRLPRPPRLIVLNGEGTLHHNAPRARDLLECLADARRAGIPAALVNSVWQDNDPDLEALARQADRIHLRDAASAEALPGATVTPDASFAAFAALFARLPAREVHALAVMDNVAADRAEALQDFATRRGAPFHAMPKHMLDRLRRRSAETGGATPALLTAPDLTTAAAWVTGRYHGLVAALAAGRPVCAVPSNTHKIEALLHDAALPEALLPQGWDSAAPADQDAAIAAALAAQDAGFAARRAAFVSDAVARIDAMFDDIAALAQG